MDFKKNPKQKNQRFFVMNFKKNPKQKKKRFFVMDFKKNKRGWIRIVEVFISILLMTGVLMLVIDRDVFEERDVSLEIHEMQISILRNVELDNSLRGDVLLASLPVSWNNFGTSGLTSVRDEIISRTSADFICEAKLCSLQDNCLFDNSIEENVYVQRVIIAADLEIYSPRQLKLFCWSG